jgi:hypothetical protein
MASKVDELCDAVIAARAAKEELKAQLHACEKTLDEAESKLAESLGDEKVSHGDFTFSSSKKVSWKTIKEGKEKLVALLKEGAPELVKESVNAASLNSFLKKNEEQLEADSPKWWKDAKGCVERSESLALSVRKAKKKK